MFIFPVQLTTSRIGNLTRLIHTLLYVMTIHTYIPLMPLIPLIPLTVVTLVWSSLVGRLFRNTALALPRHTFAVPICRTSDIHSIRADPFSGEERKDKQLQCRLGVRLARLCFFGGRGGVQYFAAVQVCDFDWARERLFTGTSMIPSIFFRAGMLDSSPSRSQTS